MISLLNDPNAELLKSYIPPFRGTWKTLPPHILPEDTVQDSMNVMLNAGTLRSRSGLELHTNAAFDTDIIGSYVFTDSGNHKAILASSLGKLYRHDHNAIGWHDITGTVSLNGDTLHSARMTSIQIGTNVYGVYCNGVDTIKQTIDGVLLQEIIPQIGSELPVLNDICTAFSRVVGITPPYTVTWCDVLNNKFPSITSWPPVNQVVLSDTEDAVIACKAVGTLGFVVYKSSNIFVGIAQAGAPSAAFRFEHRGNYEGPASPNAITSVDGAHVYMTPSGRVGYFDGSQHQWLADGIWPFLQTDIDQDNTHRIHAVYDPRIAVVTFWYPKKTDNGLCTGMLIMNWPYPLAGVFTHSYFLGQSTFPCTNSTTIPTVLGVPTSPMVYSNSNGTRHSFLYNKDYSLDNAVQFNCSFTNPLFRPAVPVPPPRDRSDIYTTIYQIYLTRGPGLGKLQLQALAASLLENTGKEADSIEIDLSSVTFGEYISPAQANPGRFVGFKASWLSDAGVAYKGCDIYGRRTT